MRVRLWFPSWYAAALSACLVVGADIPDVTPCVEVLP